MSQRVIIVTGADGNVVERSLLDKERLYIGRDKKCEIVLEDTEVSRKHAAVIYRYGVVYIENISSTGQILKNSQAIEVGEWTEGEKVQIGPFSLSWQSQDSVAPRRSGDAAPAEDLFAIDEPAFSARSSAGPAAASSSEPAPDDFFSNPPAQSAELLSAESENDGMNDMPDFMLDASPGDEPAPSESSNDDDNLSDALLGGGPSSKLDRDAPTFNSPNNLEIENASAIASSGASNTGSVSLADAEAGTAVVGALSVGVVLRVIKGEEIGREIKLTDGASWTVGRSANADIQINNPKLSREHFRLIKIGKGFRIEDMGSANGTKVNGVAVSDAPLNSYDTIQAGPVEFQFLIADPKASDVALSPPQPSMGGADFDNNSQMKTAFAPPVPMGMRNDNFNYAGSVPPGGPAFGYGASGAGFTGDARGPGMGAAPPKTPTGLSAKLQALPRGKKILYGSALVALVLMLALMSVPTPEPGTSEPTPQIGAIPDPIIAPTPDATAKPTVSDTAEISDDFYKLDPAKQKEVEELYIKADRALQAKDWKGAYEAANSILRLVTQYKNAKDILADAQTNLNEGYVGSFNQSLNNVGEADAQNQEKAALLLENAGKALSDARWDDAEESYSAVLVLDPNNEEAVQGLAKARAKDPNASVDAPTGPAAEPDPGQVAYQRENDLMNALNLQFEDARNQMNNGLFGQALDVLRALEQKVRVKSEEFRDADRTPAAIRDTFFNQSKMLQMKVEEAIDTANTQLRTEYQSQLADAEEFINNKQYASARDIYDKIVKFEPAFQDAIDARRRLYDKMIVEGRNFYQEALIYESVGDLDLAVEGYQKTRDLLANVEDYTATEYFKRSVKKLQKFGK